MSEPVEEPIVFGSGVEALRNALERHLTPALREELLHAGFDLNKVMPAYPMDQWVDALRIVARHLAPQLPEHDQYVHLGRQFMKGFVSTAVGKAALAISRVIGPRRTLLRMGRNFKQATNYIETQTSEVAERELHLRIYTHDRFLGKTRDRSTLVTDYRRGVLEAVLELIHVEGTVDITDVHPERQDVTFRLRWK